MIVNVEISLFIVVLLGFVISKSMSSLLYKFIYLTGARHTLKIHEMYDREAVKVGHMKYLIVILLYIA